MRFYAGRLIYPCTCACFSLTQIRLKMQQRSGLFVLSQCAYVLKTPYFSFSEHLPSHYSSSHQVLSIEGLDIPTLPVFFQFLLYRHRVRTEDFARNRAEGVLYIFGRPGYRPYTGEKPKNRALKDPTWIDLFSLETLYRCEEIRSTTVDNGE